MMMMGGPGGGMMNPAALMAQMPPEMAEMAKRAMEQRQQLMQEFAAKGGQSNPAAVQELMSKAAQMQQSMMAELKTKMSTGELSNLAFSADQQHNMPINPIDRMEKTAAGGVRPAESFLGASANMAKLDELMNKKYFL